MEVKKALWKYQQEIERAENIVKTDFICLEFIEYVPFFLENILETLKANAIQYRDLSRPSVIQIRTKVKNQTRLLIVRDNGRVTGLKSQELGIFNSMDAHSGYFGVMVPPVSVKPCHFERSYNYS
jgi:hypothetical protein